MKTIDAENKNIITAFFAVNNFVPYFSKGLLSIFIISQYLIPE